MSTTVLACGEMFGGAGLRAAEKAEAFLQAQLVFLAVIFRKLSLIARDKQWFLLSLLHANLLLLNLGFCSAGTAERCMKSKCPSWRGKATAGPRGQGRRCWAFIGAKRKPLTEEAAGSGAGFSQEGQANQVARSQGKHVTRTLGDFEPMRHRLDNDEFGYGKRSAGE